MEDVHAKAKRRFESRNPIRFQLAARDRESIGTAGIIASVVQLNDHAAVPMMVDVHRYLRAGQTLAEAMCSIRCGLSDDPLQQATAMSLVALGAG
ncbi:MAG: hypothetical protein ACTHPS_21530 [Streptosporangiaceae bacterium]